jgi:hypothetical protein
MTDPTPGGWPDAARPGVPQSPERDGPCVLRAPDGAEHDVFWNAREQQYEWPHDGWLTPANATEFGWRLVKQDRLYTEAEVAAQVEAAAPVIEAARCIKHWHDREPDGMVVSAEHVRALWDVLDQYDAAIRARGDA